MTNPLLAFMQLCDSNFPSGAFSHSFGLETYIYEGIIQDAETFEQVLHAYINGQMIYTDALACRLAYEAIGKKDWATIVDLDEQLAASSLARETREGIRRMGERLVKLCTDLYESDDIRQYALMVKQKQAVGHPSIVFALAASHLQAPLHDTMMAHLFGSVQSLVQNAVRAVPLGQTDGQRILIRVQSVIEAAVQRTKNLDKSELGRTMPGLEIAQMKHEQLPVRLFMS